MWLLPFFTTCSRIENILIDLREKKARNLLRANNPELPGSADEEDAKVLSALQEKTFDQCVEARCKYEKEGKCRCCYASCNKLFKDITFATKHMHLKHEDFAAEETLVHAEPYMRARYEAEPLSCRPLPPVEVEAHGRTELKSVLAIQEAHLRHTADGTGTERRGSFGGRGDGTGGGGGRWDNNRGSGGRNWENNNNPRRWSGGAESSGSGGGHQQGGEHRRRGQDDRDRRTTIGGSGEHARRQAPVAQYVEPKSEDNFSRKISNYIDVDAPKVIKREKCVFCSCFVLLCACIHTFSQSSEQLHGGVCYFPHGIWLHFNVVILPMLKTCYNCGILFCHRPVIYRFDIFHTVYTEFRLLSAENFLPILGEHDSSLHSLKFPHISCILFLISTFIISL